MDTIFKNNIYRILELFIEHPAKDYSIRGIARDLKLNHATVLNHIGHLQKLNIINKKEETLYPTYYANTENQKYKFYKRNYIIFKITESGIAEYIKTKTLASSIILFGSCAKGAFTENSDIDLFIEAKEQKLDLNKYEKALKRKTNLLFEQDISNLSAELRNNILNGIILEGFIKLRK